MKSRFMIPMKRAVRVASAGASPIKGNVSSTEEPDLYPGFSASGQDVWLTRAPFAGTGFVLSAVGARCGKVFLASGQWGVVANTAVLLPREGHHAKYLWYVLNREDWWQKGGTAQPYVRVEESLTQTVYLPSLEEQQRLADFLDRETQRVDAVLREVGALQDLLSERQVAAIDSGVLPKPGNRDSWPTYRLKHIAAVPISTGVGLPAEHEDESWPRYIRTTDISGPTSLRDDVFFSQPPELLQSAGVEYGDLLMTAAGSVGQSYLHLTHNPAVYAGYLARFRPKKDVDSRFVAYWAQSSDYWMQIEQGAVRSTIDNFSAGRYRNMVLALPSLSEQVRIADELDELAELNSRARSLLSSLGDLLVERRRSLITAAVTGQVDIEAVV